MDQLQSGGGGSVDAPTDAQYIVAAANATLTAERVATNTTTVTWDFATAAQAKANVPNLSGTNTGDQTSIVGITGTTAEFNTALSDANFATGGGTATGTNTGDQTLPTRASLGLDTTDSPQFAGINVGAAADTTITRVSAGVIAVEGVQLQPLDTQLTSVAALAYAGNALKTIRVNAGETDFELATASAAVAWGAITGTITNQTDLLIFKTIAVAGQSDVVADTATDTLTLVAGTNITITTNAGTDTITITGAAGGSGLSQGQVVALTIGLALN